MLNIFILFRFTFIPILIIVYVNAMSKKNIIIKELFDTYFNYNGNKYMRREKQCNKYQTIVLLNLQKPLETVVDKVQIVLLLQTTTIW